MCSYFMVKKILIAGRKTRSDYVLKFRGSNTYHRVPAKSLMEAIAKILKGTRHTFADVILLSPQVLKRYKAQGGTNF